MGFIDPKKQQEDDELPGSGLHLDLEQRRCPDCRREVLPWQDTCPDCGVAAVLPTELEATGFALPGLTLDDLDDGSDADGLNSDGLDDGSDADGLNSDGLDSNEPNADT